MIQAVGYLYRGAAVEILSKDEQWTQIESGNVTGYVMNDYLVSGDAARGLAEYYGKEGVVANWNDVNVFTGKMPQPYPDGLHRNCLPAGLDGDTGWSSSGERTTQDSFRRGCFQDASG